MHTTVRSLKEAFLVTRAVTRAILDSERTDEIHVIQEITGRHSIQKFMQGLTPAEKDQFHPHPELKSQQLDYDSLRAMAPGTLGHAYVSHLDNNGLTPDTMATPTRFIDDPELSYWVRRCRQTHDVWHTLLGLGVAGHEETVLHAFTWGQLRLPVSALVLFFGTLKHIIIERRWTTLRHALLEAYHLGNNAPPLLAVRWETLWETPLEEIRTRFNLHPCTPQYIHAQR